MNVLLVMEQLNLELIIQYPQNVLVLTDIGITTPNYVKNVIILALNAPVVMLIICVPNVLQVIIEVKTQSPRRHFVNALADFLMLVIKVFVMLVIILVITVVPLLLIIV